jgi:hypothetical protein
MHTARFQFRHLAASLLILGGAAFVWHNAQALSAGATPDKSNNPRMVGGVVKPPETCSKSGCHDGPPASCAGKVEVLGLPGCYVPGQVYDLSVKVTDANATRWGFEVGAQYSEGNQQDYNSAGSIDNDPAARTQKVTSADGQRSFITHSKASANGDGTYPGQAGSATWNFKWTAPGAADRQTTVCFYVAGLAADNDGTTDGDCTYNTTVCVDPCGPTPTHRTTWGEVKTRYKK